jgi:hypothetical protein
VAAVNSPTAAISITIPIRRLRRDPIGSISSKAPSATSPRATPLRTLAAALLVCTITFTAVAPVAGVTLTGEGTVHVSPEGAPLHEKLTVPA